MIQQPDGRYHWERGQTQPLCYECEAVCDLYRYKHNGNSLYFCSQQCADKWAADNNAEADHTTQTIYDKEPYNGAAFGYSPYDLMDFECRSCFEQGGADDLTDSHLMTLTGLRTSIKDHDVTIDEAFPDVKTIEPGQSKTKQAADAIIQAARDKEQ